jgi:hypothetical protein
MKCERCNGLMLEDHFMDMKDLSEGMWVSSWRCMNCGHAADPIMIANRQRHAPLLQVRQEEMVQETYRAATTVEAA